MTQIKTATAASRLRRALRSTLGLVAMVSAGWVEAASITDVEFNARQGGRFEVRLNFDGAPPEPKGYTIERPARIALDFPGTSSDLKQKRFPLSFDNANSAMVLEGNGRTRMVINLVELVPFSTRVDGNAVVIDVGTPGAKDYLRQTTENTVFTRKTESSKRAERDNRISDLDFRRGENGEGRLVVTLSNPKSDINVYVEGSRIKAELRNVFLPDNLQRRFDVKDFATPVQVIDASVTRSGTLLSLQAAGEYDYLAYQADNEYVISVKPLAQDEIEEKRKEFAYVGEKLSLNFQNIEVRAVLQLIADFTELNLVASDTVSGSITLRLQNVPWDQALDLVLKTKGLDKRLVGNVLLVAPAAEIAERERQEIEAKKQVEELAPLQTEYIRVKYADAGELFKLFSGAGQGGGNRGGGRSDQGPSTGSILSPRGTVIVDERTNSLLITETAEKLEEFRRLLRLIDVPVRQVQIEARIVRANTGWDESLGVRWSGTPLRKPAVATSGGANPGFGGPSSLPGNAVVSNPGVVVDLGLQGVSGAIGIGFISQSVAIDLELSALASQGNGEVVSQPKVITGDKEPANIKSGTEIPYPESSANGETTIAFKEAVLELDVTPIITPDDRIQLEIKISQDSVGELAVANQGVQIPTIDTTELTTKVLVGNGETVVLGGIFGTSELYAETKVPFFSDIPYLGRLFKSKSVSQDKQEVLIFVTPRILADTLID